MKTTKTKRHYYYLLTDPRAVSVQIIIKCDATDATAETLREIESNRGNVQKIRARKGCDYVIRHGNIYLYDARNNYLIHTDMHNM